MAPWEKYGAQKAAGPWERYAPPTTGDMPEWAKSSGLTQDTYNQFKAAQQQMRTGTGAAMARGAGDLLSFGLSEKIPAAGEALRRSVQDGGSIGDNYNAALGEERALREGDQQNHYWSRKTGQAVGLGMGMKGPSANPFGKATLPARIGNAATTGALYGSVAGAAQDADSLKDRGLNALFGAGKGAAIGAAAYPLAAGAAKTWDALLNFFTSRGAAPKATNIILDQLKASGMTPREAWLKMQQLGKQGMLADVSPNMQVATGGAAVADPAARNMISQRLADRTSQGGERIGKTLDDAFGPATDPYAFKKAAQDATKATDPAYELAKDYDVDLSTFSDWLTKQVQSYNNKGPIGSKLAAVRDMITDSNGHLITNGGQVHMARRQIDAMIESARAAGEKGVAGELNKARMGLDLPLKETVPGFLEADAARAQSYRAQDAFDVGRDVLKGGPQTMTPAQVAAEVARRGGDRASEVGNMQQGMRTEIDRVLSNQRQDPALQTDRILSRDWNKEKAAALIGQDKIPGLDQGINRELTFRDTARFADPRNGSPTAAREAAARDIFGAGQQPSAPGQILGGAIGGGVVGGPQGAVMGGLAAGANTLRSRVVAAMTGKANPEVIAQAADMLTSTGAAREPVIKALEDAFARLPAKQNSVETVRRLLQSAITVGGVNVAKQIQPQPQIMGPR
jgi:hypothetical protein